MHLTLFVQLGSIMYLALINRAGGLYGRILTRPRSPAQTERSEVCTSDQGEDSLIQTNLAWLIRCLLYGQTRKQRNKNINNFICFPARAQAFSWLSSVTGLQSKRDKNNCSKSSFVQTLYKQANFFIFFVCNFLRTTVTTRSV